MTTMTSMYPKSAGISQLASRSGQTVEHATSWTGPLDAGVGTASFKINKFLDCHLFPAPGIVLQGITGRKLVDESKRKVWTGTGVCARPVHDDASNDTPLSTTGMLIAISNFPAHACGPIAPAVPGDFMRRISITPAST